VENHETSASLFAEASPYSAEEVADVFALCFDLGSALELAEFIQNNNHGN
jgi:hypothetical protein